MRLSIRLKLGLLAGIPVFGAAILAFLIVTSAQSDAAKASALGSIESLAELSQRMTDLVHALQGERAASARSLGKTHGQGPVSVPAAAGITDRQLSSLSAFLSQRDESRLPRRLSAALHDAREHLRSLPEFRTKLADATVPFSEIDTFFSKGARSLIRATSGLTDLSDDGELLRILDSLSIALELEERMSEEHALLADVFEERGFPPGSYRQLVSIMSEEEIYASVYRTSSTLQAVRLLDGVLSGPVVEKSHALRRVALETNEDDLEGDPDEWFALGNENLAAIGRAERHLNDASRSAALDKLSRTRRSVNFSVGLAGTVIVVSLVLAWLIAYGLTRRVVQLRDLSQLVAAGDLNARVSTESTDELGELASSFNDMVGKLKNAQAALGEQARMTRELEIAATIQRAMLPPHPVHEEFEFAGRMRPADEVGGDFYDVLTAPDANALWITMGDVSGHGVGAGLVMLMAQAAFASHFLDDASAEPARVLRAVNTLLCENIKGRLHDDKYVTTQLLVRTGPGKFDCVGAHEWPLVFRARTGKCETIEAPGPWLGIQPDLPMIPTYRIELEPGDVLCLYSDGIAEARDDAGTLFDVERMTLALEKALGGGAPLAGALDDLFQSAEHFSGRHDDDWTVLLVRKQ